MLSFEDATALHNHDIGSLLGDASPMGVPGWSHKLLQNLMAILQFIVIRNDVNPSYDGIASFSF